MNQLIKSALHMTGDILSDPDRRCINMSAQNSAGMSVEPTDEKACKWCLTGALCKAFSELGIEGELQFQTYSELRAICQIDTVISAPMFWDANPDLHDSLANKLRTA